MIFIFAFGDGCSGRARSFYIGTIGGVTAGGRRARRAPSLGVVKDHAERISLAGAKPAHAVAKRHAVRAALALHGSVPYREDHGVTLVQGHDLALGLRAR